MPDPIFQAQFEQRLSSFLAHAQDLHDAWTQRIAPSAPRELITTSVGRRFIAVWKADRDEQIGRSIYAFIDRGNGDLYKPKTRQAPAPKVRGNLFEPDNGFHCMNWHGVQ
jgi:hypothetical protein